MRWTTNNDSLLHPAPTSTTIYTTVVVYSSTTAAINNDNTEQRKKDLFSRRRPYSCRSPVVLLESSRRSEQELLSERRIIYRNKKSSRQKRKKRVVATTSTTTGAFAPADGRAGRYLLFSGRFAPSKLSAFSSESLDLSPSTCTFFITTTTLYSLASRVSTVECTVHRTNVKNQETSHITQPMTGFCRQSLPPTVTTQKIQMIII